MHGLQFLFGFLCGQPRSLRSQFVISALLDLLGDGLQVRIQPAALLQQLVPLHVESAHVSTQLLPVSGAS
jgi:hypothetical protein